jgi:hypothetical protein
MLNPLLGVAFVTKDVYTGNLGGLLGADMKCQTAATAGGRTGNFVAFLSTSTTNAISRVSASRGWQRTDATPVIDTVTAALNSSQQYGPIIDDQFGAVVSFAGTGTELWTGSLYTGNYDGTGHDCSDWASTTLTGWIGDLTTSGPQMVNVGLVTSCSGSAHLLCFETGKTMALAQPSQPITGRIAFVSSLPAGTTFADFDTQCASDATAASLPGTYLAAVATTTATIRSRFTIDARPVQRRDGTVVATSADRLLSTSDLPSPVNQLANGTYTSNLVWTGAPNAATVGTAATTCTNWTDTSGTTTGEVGDASSVASASFWGGRGINCGTRTPVLCLQQ